MIAMRSFAVTLATAWIALGAAAIWYSNQQNIPSRVTLAVAAALALESGLYLMAGFEPARSWWRRLGSTHAIAAALALSAVAPYSIYSLALGLFRPGAAVVLFLLAALVASWYVWLPRRAVVDIGFLLLMAGVALGGVFPMLYVRPFPRVPAELLGELMWVRVGVMAALLIRRVEGVDAGFLPSARDWLVGVRYFLYLAPVVATLAWALDFARPRAFSGDWGKLLVTLAGTFLGMLWFVAFREEFFFRGLLQQWLSRWLNSGASGLVTASVVFGLVHLPFRQFPNWKFVILASVAGCFYGRAYQQAGSIRAAMVTHALANTAWRVFFA